MATLLQYLLENGREEFIVQHMGPKIDAAIERDMSAPKTALRLVQSLKTMDPTPAGKFLQYLVNQYIKSNFRVEDAERVRTALDLFIRKRNTLQQKDINQYKSIHDLYDAVEEAPDPVLSGKQQAKATKAEGTDVIVKEPGFLVLHLKTAEAAVFYAAGTKWCTSSPEIFKNYAHTSPIFLILIKTPEGETRKFQFHYSSSQIMNEKDVPVSSKEIKLLSSFPGWYEFIDKMTQKHWTQLEPSK